MPMRSIECSRCLREVLYTCILEFLTNNGMPPANIFDILVRSVLTALSCAGAQITRFRRGCMGNILRRSIPFFKPEQPLYAYSIDLLILQEGLQYLFVELRHVEHGAKCAYREHLGNNLLRQCRGGANSGCTGQGLGLWQCMAARRETRP